VEAGMFTSSIDIGDDGGSGKMGLRQKVGAKIDNFLINTMHLAIKKV